MITQPTVAFDAAICIPTLMKFLVCLCYDEEGSPQRDPGCVGNRLPANWEVVAPSRNSLTVALALDGEHECMRVACF